MSEDPFVELYRAHGRTIYARCRRLLGDGAAAEDATQEAFVRLHRHLGKHASADDTLKWIYRVATNCCITELRKRRLRPEAQGLQPGAAISASLQDVLADRDSALRVIAGVSEKLAEAALLHHVDGIDQTEVARILGVSRRTVVYRLAQFADLARGILRSA
jgi:RNA polymerase sigma-70 factor (ECF subfamily)